MRPESHAHAAHSAPGEVDVWWGGYAGRTMLPSFAGCALLTVALALIAWRLYVLGYPPGVLRHCLYGLAGLLWVIQVSLWLHRCIAITYRLTNRRLYRDRGFLLAHFDAIELPTITEVIVAQDRIERWLGVGRVRLVLHPNDSHSLVLSGVSDPARLAKEIRRAQRRLLEREGKHEAQS